MLAVKEKETISKISEVLEGKAKGIVQLRGWIHRKRVQGNIIFFSLRDSTGVIQLAVKKDGVSEKEFKDAEKALIESTITVKGEVKKDERAPGGFEVQVKSILHQMLLSHRWSVPSDYRMPVQQAPISKPLDGLPIQIEAA